MDTLRSSIRRIWHLAEYPGSLVIRVLLDLLVLAGLGLLLLIASLAVGTIVRREPLGRRGEHGGSLSRWLLSAAVGWWASAGTRSSPAAR